jgi:copper chaperone CopZ
MLTSFVPWMMQMVVLRVSMHCNGCARKVKKHVSKMEGTSNNYFRTCSFARI